MCIRDSPPAAHQTVVQDRMIASPADPLFHSHGLEGSRGARRYSVPTRLIPGYKHPLQAQNFPTCLCRRRAAAQPAGPAPTTTTSTLQDLIFPTRGGAYPAADGPAVVLSCSRVTFLLQSIQNRLFRQCIVVVG